MAVIAQLLTGAGGGGEPTLNSTFDGVFRWPFPGKTINMNAYGFGDKFFEAFSSRLAEMNADMEVCIAVRSFHGRAQNEVPCASLIRVNLSKVVDRV